MVKTVVTGFLQENCYIIDDGLGHAIVIDPGANFYNISQYINQNQLEIEAVLLTHAHFDHVGAIDEVCQKYHCPLYLNLSDLPFINAYTYEPKFQKYNAKVHTDPSDIDLFKSKYFNISIINVPGHSPGSILIVFENEKLLFSGDTLFFETIGRTDLDLSSPKDMKNSLKTIKSIKYNYAVYPGHGQSTTINYEKAHNPYLI